MSNARKDDESGEVTCSCRSSSKSSKKQDLLNYFNSTTTFIQCIVMSRVSMINKLIEACSCYKYTYCNKVFTFILTLT